MPLAAILFALTALESTYSYFHQSRPPSSFAATQLPSVIRKKWLREGIIDAKSLENIRLGDNDEEADEYPNEPNWFKMFPRERRQDSIVVEREEPNYEELEVDDPIFLDMDWPTESGPRAAAYARHMQWRRQLADVERA